MENLNRAALIILAQKIRNAEGDSEEENNQLLDDFLNNVPDPNAGNYFFDQAFDDLTAEEIVDRALSYRPIRL